MGQSKLREVVKDELLLGATPRTEPTYAELETARRLLEAPQLWILLVVKKRMEEWRKRRNLPLYPHIVPQQ